MFDTRKQTRHNLLMTKIDDVGDRWASDLVKRVGLAVKIARAGKSAAWLSDRTAELGYRISPTVIAKLDSGHRGTVLSVSELLILAAALDVPPLALLFPDLPDGKVEVVPGHTKVSLDAYLWATGENQRSAAAKLIELSRRRENLMKHLVHLEITQSLHQNDGDEVMRKSRERELSAVRDELNQTDAAILELGGTLHYA